MKNRPSEPQPLPVTLEWKGRLLVAKAATDVPVLRTETVERIQRQLQARNLPRK